MLWNAHGTRYPLCSKQSFHHASPRARRYYRNHKYKFWIETGLENQPTPSDRSERRIRYGKKRYELADIKSELLLCRDGKSCAIVTETPLQTAQWRADRVDQQKERNNERVLETEKSPRRESAVDRNRVDRKCWALDIFFFPHPVSSSQCSRRQFYTAVRIGVQDTKVSLEVFFSPPLQPDRRRRSRMSTLKGSAISIHLFLNIKKKPHW